MAIKNAHLEKQKEKERQAELKALREELSREIEEQLLPRLAEEEASGIQTQKFSCDATNEEDAKRIIEAILFTASKPVTIGEFKRVLPSINASRIQKLISDLQSEYEREGRSFRVQAIANGFECSTLPEFAPWIMKLELQKKARQATQSALETLAILAYRQPVTKAEIEELRGVDVTGVLTTLMDRHLVKIVGRKEVPGRPFLYGTTDKFLEHFGLKSLKDLPDISELQSLVENSVKKEELLRTGQIIPLEEAGAEQPVPSDSVSSEPALNSEEQVPESEDFSDNGLAELERELQKEELTSEGLIEDEERPANE